jgi:DNA repair protein RecO (recombination protein O)
MNQSYKGVGIVVKHGKFGEGHQIVRVLFEDKGLVDLIAHGVGRSNSRKAPHLDLLNKVSLEVSRGSTPQSISQAESLQSFANLKRTLPAIRSCFYILEIINNLVPLEQNEVELFRALVAHLEKINNDPSLWDKETLRFLKFLIPHLGYDLPSEISNKDLGILVENILERKMISPQMK